MVWVMIWCGFARYPGCCPRGNDWYIVAAGKPFVVGWLDNFMGLDPFTETGFFAQGCFDSFRFVSNDL